MTTTNLEGIARRATETEETTASHDMLKLKKLTFERRSHPIHPM
jgi:hypothetical protein